MKNGPNRPRRCVRPCARWRVRLRSRPSRWGGRPGLRAGPRQAHPRTARRSNRRRSLPASRHDPDPSAGDTASTLLLDKTLVALLVHQAVQFLRVVEAKLDEPALAQNGRIDFACRLDRFDHGSLRALRDPVTDFWQLDINDIAEL